MLMIEAGRWLEDDALAYSALKDAGVPCVLVINKVDKIADKTKLFPFIAEVTAGREFALRASDFRAEAQGHAKRWSRTLHGAGAGIGGALSAKTRSPTAASASSPASWCASS